MSKPLVVPCRYVMYHGGPMHGISMPSDAASLWDWWPVVGCRNQRHEDRQHRYRRVWLSRALVAHYEYAGIWLTDDTSEEPL